MRINVRHLICLPGRDGLPRYFWQPSSKLRAQGWRPERVPADWSSHTDPATLEAAAIARASALNEQLDSLRIDAALAAAPLAPPQTKSARTVRELLAAFQASDDWTRLAPATRRGYSQCLRKIEEWASDAPVRAIDGERVEKLKHALGATPAYAAAVVRVLRLVLGWGSRNGWIAKGSNPAANPNLAGAEPTGLIWPREAVVAFVAAADALGHHSMGTAVLLNEWLGQRQGDIIRMPRVIYRNGTLLISQHKTGARVALPIDLVAPLKARLAEEMARQQIREAKPGALRASTIIVSEETGRPYLADNFRHVFARVRAHAARTTPSFAIDYLLPGRDMTDADAFQVRMADLTFMALRHTAVTRLAEAGCTAEQIAVITGHELASITTILRRYLVRTAEIARGAFQQRLDAEAPGVKSADILEIMKS